MKYVTGRHAMNLPCSLGTILRLGIIDMRVKLSGISDLYSAKIAEEYNADFISFNFDTADKDYLTLEHAHVIAQQIPETRKVGEFRNMPLNYVNKAADSVGVDYVQLNGSESDRYIKRVERPVIKRFVFDDDFTLEKAEKCPAEMILIDIGAQDFQNEKLADIIAKMHKSVIVAAKVDRKNVLALNHVLKPYAVDVSDCLEVNGVKNYKKITSFMRHVHSLQGNVIYKLP